MFAPPPPLPIACVAGRFKGLGVYGEGNYGERNEKDACNIIRRRREKIGTRRGEEENAGEKNRLPQNSV